MLSRVILLETIRNLGRLGDIVKVKAGYARNYLIPYGKATKATDANLAEFEKRRAELEQKAADQLAIAQKRADQLKGFTITLIRKALEEGKLFGSVGIRDLVDAFKEKGITIEKNEISLPHGPIRSIGEYEIEILLHSDIVVPVKVVITAEV